MSEIKKINEVEPEVKMAEEITVEEEKESKVKGFFKRNGDKLKTAGKVVLGVAALGVAFALGKGSSDNDDSDAIEVDDFDVSDDIAMDNTDESETV
nr:MAG TPA: hypothetical protein [Bacteriophage sp.]